MKQASVLLATARAHSVFPVPGGPYNNTPLGGSTQILNQFFFKIKSFVRNGGNLDIQRDNF